MLRCGYCEQAMLPRRDGDLYVCRTNKATKGAGSCPMPTVKRAAVESAALGIFERIALDVDATREHIAAQLDARLREVAAAAESAEREFADKESQLARVERDYLAGQLSAKSYERLGDRVRDDLRGASAERERLTTHAAALRQTAHNLDAEDETLRRLAELRVAIATRVNAAREQSKATEDLAALRAAMARVFKHILLIDGGHPVARLEDVQPTLADHAVADHDLYVQPVLADAMVQGYTDDARPILGRVALPFTPGSTVVSGSGVPE